MEPIAGSYRIHRRTLRSACFVASRLCPISSITVGLVSFPLFVSPGGAGCRLAPSFPYSIAYLMWLRLLACRRRCRLRVSSRRAVLSCVSCLLAARLVCAVSSHHRRHLDRRFDRRLHVLRHGWAGREAGSVGVLLAWFCPAVCADIDSRFTPFPLRCPLGLLACWLGCGAMASHLVRAGCVAMLCLPIGSSRLSPRSSSRRSGRLRPSLSPRLATRWAGRRADAVRLRRAIVPRFDFDACFAPPLCLLASGRSSLAPSPPDADSGGGLWSIGSAGSAFLPRYICAVSSLSSRIPAASSHGSFD